MSTNLSDAAAQLLTPGEAAEYIGVQRNTVHVQIKRKRIATVQTYGGTKLITVAEAIRYRAVTARRRAGPGAQHQLRLSEPAADAPASPKNPRPQPPAPVPAPPPSRTKPSEVSLSF